MARTARAPIPPPPIDGPLTVDAVAAIFDTDPQTVRRWAREGRLGKGLGTHSATGRGRGQKVFDPWDVLNYGCKTGRLDPYWNRTNAAGRVQEESDRAGRRGYTIRAEPTRDLDGRVYYFVPHAARLIFGVDTRTVETWRSRPHLKFPDPDEVLEGKPTWFKPTLVRWGQNVEPPRLNEAGEPDPNPAPLASA
ncbi:helix-turn-helix domain-containing protein [Streptomyces sp. NPDC049879]|uniref:helix-turn-helix domain-containing protein n=1 Tax=Streptomyces sp. NPDC049879 TaxID=3365598 RepID=UPI003789355A